MDRDNLQNCILELYDAAVNPSRWRHALNLVAEEVGGVASMVLVRKPEGWRRDLQLLSNRYLDFSRSAEGMYYGLRYSRLQNPDWNYLSECQPMQPTWDLEAGYTAHELDRRKDYSYLISRVGVRRRLGVRLNDDRLWFDALSVGFPDDMPGGSPDQKALLHSVLPHLSKSIEMSRIFLALRRKHKAALTALDHVEHALIVVDAKQNIIVANAKADQVFGESMLISKDQHGRLCCSDDLDTRKLKAAIETACKIADGNATITPNSTWLNLTGDGAASLAIDVAPIRDTSDELDESNALALITLTSPDHLPAINLKSFAKAYSLTRAETEVCELAFSGLSIGVIAERRNTSPNTVKSQVATILSKTNSNSRLELIHLITRTHPKII